MQAADSFCLALRQLGWSRSELLPLDPTPTDCYLKWAIRYQQTHSKKRFLTAQGQRSLERLVGAGLSLRGDWPGSKSVITREWLGERFYFSSPQNLDGAAHLGSIISSQVGRDFRKLPDWPRMLQRALQTIQQDRLRLLSVAGTTMHQAVLEFSGTIDMDRVEFVLPKEASADQEQLAEWICKQLDGFSINDPVGRTRNQIFLSPEFVPSVAYSWLSHFPLQDRVSIAIADRVMALSIRKNGTIASLLDQRLSDSRFPRGTVFVAMVKEIVPSRQPRSEREDDWMNRGAVGWLILDPPGLHWQSLSPCRLANSLQFSAPARSVLSGKRDDWPYLTHCTRGNSGPLPQESEAGYYRRMWLAGSELPAHPLATLIRILRDGRLRSTHWLTRGDCGSVSLTAVPLDELLSRRKFQSHLGRWDWEPYGLLFNKRFLPQARPVIYAAQRDYDRMPTHDRVYFQPDDSKYDWSQEREWRVAGDVDLRSLPPEAALVFVRRRSEAIPLARQSPFPVVWIEGNS